MEIHLRTTWLLATWHKQIHPALAPASEGWYLIYLPRRDGRLSWPRCPDYRGIEPMTARSEVRRPTTAPPRHVGTAYRVEFLTQFRIMVIVWCCLVIKRLAWVVISRLQLLILMLITKLMPWMTLCDWCPLSPWYEFSFMPTCRNY